MKKTLCALVALFFLLPLYACSLSVETPTPTPAPSPIPTLDVTVEPPLDEWTLPNAVPDFLDEDQQLLYRRACCVYSHLFGGDTAEVNWWGGEGGNPVGLNDVEYNGTYYTKAVGRYARWDDFNALIQSVFTDELWARRNGLGGTETYVDIDGDLHFTWASRGMYYYNDNFPDTFELISMTEDEVNFTLIGHYSSPWPNEGETIEERDQRLESGWEYTIEFPMRMVRTENGWLFDEFHTAPSDQKGPPGE